MFSDHILTFYKKLSLTARLPDGVSFMNPYQDEKAFEVCSRFFKKYYDDNQPRTMIMGINPGRFGGGITGVPFTDPIKLERVCGITNDFAKKGELSADFVYAMIDAFGGPERFYGHYYISALSPLGFMKDGKNLNYYDIRDLQNAIEPFMINCIVEQLSFGINREKCFCLGEGDNYRYLSALNRKHNFFQAVEALPHPRFIMQYKRKKLQDYIATYLSKLNSH